MRTGRLEIKDTLRKTLHRNFAVVLFNLDSDCSSAQVSSGYQSGTASHERIDNNCVFRGEGGKHSRDCPQWLLIRVEHERFAFPREDVGECI